MKFMEGNYRWKYIKNPPKESKKCYFHFINLTMWGSGIVIESPEVNVLIDLGYRQGTDEIEECLIKRGITRLDLVVITHPHRDHTGSQSNGIRRFLENYNVQEIWSVGQPLPVWYDNVTQWPPGDLEHLNSYTDLISQIFPNGHTIASEGSVPGIVGESVVPYAEPRQGEEHIIGDLIIKVLHPTSDISTGRGLNEQSMVIQVIFGDTKVLISGDCTNASHYRIMGYYNNEELKSDVLYLAHHGLYDATSPLAWIDTVRPKFTTLQNASGTVADRTYTELGKRNIPINDPRALKHDVVVTSDGNSISVLSDEYNWRY